jgi:polyisoprenoid-binding protein YceI
MPRPAPLASPVAAASALLCAALLAAPARAETYEVDRSHSTVIFKIKHAGVGNFYGRFNDVRGTLALDDAAPEKASVAIEVKTDSVDTASADRDRHIKGEGSLAAEKHPILTFKSKKVKKAGADAFVVTGDLGFRGVTREIEVKAARTGTTRDEKGGGKAGFEGTFRLRRSDFGWKGMGGLSDEVDVIVSLECNLKKPTTAAAEE